MGFVGGAAGGAATGSLFGPWGAGIGAGLGGLLGLFGGGGDKPLSPEAERLLDFELQRMYAQDPLYQRTAQLAFDRLPTAARAGIAGPDSAHPGYNVSGDGDYAQPHKVRELLAAQEGRLQMTKPLIEAVTRLAQLRMPKGYQAYRPRTRDTAPGGPGGGRDRARDNGFTFDDRGFPIFDRPRREADPGGK